MTAQEIRQAKAELHKTIIDAVLSFGGTAHEDAMLYHYIIELASKELLTCIPKNN